MQTLLHLSHHEVFLKNPIPLRCGFWDCYSDSTIRLSKKQNSIPQSNPLRKFFHSTFHISIPNFGCSHSNSKSKSLRNDGLRTLVPTPTPAATTLLEIYYYQFRNIPHCRAWERDYTRSTLNKTKVPHIFQASWHIIGNGRERSLHYRERTWKKTAILYTAVV